MKLCDTIRMSQPNTRTLGAEELNLRHFSLAPMHDIEERVRLTSESFSGIGLYIGQCTEREKSGAPIAHSAALTLSMRKF